MDIKISKEKSASRWDGRENLIYVRCNSIKNYAQRQGSETLNEVKPNKNINKSQQVFLGTSPVQKEIPPLHKL